MSNEQMTTLKPCPFCGNDGSGPIEDSLHISQTENPDCSLNYSVQCDKCTATMGYSETEEYAADCWNTRAPEAERIKELEAALVLLRHERDLAWAESRMGKPSIALKEPKP